MWQVQNKPEYVSQCSKMNGIHKLYINEYPLAKIKKLMEYYTPQRLEWLAYFIGDYNEITDIYVPTQEVTNVTVKYVESPSHIFIPGCIHSHHVMSNGFSGIDDRGINENNDISICISVDGMQGHIRKITDCGAYIFIPLDIQLETNFDTINTDSFNLQYFIDTAIQNIHDMTQNSIVADLDNLEEEFFIYSEDDIEVCETLKV